MKKVLSLLVALFLITASAFGDDAVDYVNSGYAKETNGNSDGALADYSKAIELKPDFAKAYIFRGNVRKDEGDFDGAIADYNMAIDLNWLARASDAMSLPLFGNWRKQPPASFTSCITKARSILSRTVRTYAGMVLSPSTPNEYMSSILSPVPVRNSNSARMRWALPMTAYPYPTTVPCPSASNPNKTNAGTGGNYFYYGRWWIANDINFLRSGIGHG
jgi:tetratricopeptide (TPR) repeat protein